jgi:two-component system, NarL family, invasion response regulator UvrY
MTRILLVDDHELLRRGLRLLLLEEYPQAVISEAGTVAQALNLIHAGPWELVVLDINLPGGSGLDLLTEVKRQQPNVAVLMLSSYPEEEFAVRAFKLGASGYLTKSSVAEEMLRAARKALQGGRYVSLELGEKLAGTLGRRVAGAPHETLSRRELAVLRLVASGRTLKQIAAELSLSEKTVSTYRTRLAVKIGLSSNVELTRYALQHELVE